MNPLGIQIKIPNHLKMRKELNWSQTVPLKHSVLQNSEKPKRLSKKRKQNPNTLQSTKLFFQESKYTDNTKCSGNESFFKRNRQLKNKWKNCSKRACSEHWIHMTVGRRWKHLIKYGYRIEYKYFKTCQCRINVFNKSWLENR